MQNKGELLLFMHVGTSAVLLSSPSNVASESVLHQMECNVESNNACLLEASSSVFFDGYQVVETSRVTFRHPQVPVKIRQNDMTRWCCDFFIF